MNRADMMKSTIRNMEIILGNMPIGTHRLDKFHRQQLNLLIAYKNHFGKVSRAKAKLEDLEK